MALIIETNLGPMEVSDAQVRAVIRIAQRHAVMTGTALQAITEFNPKSSRLPAAFLLELGAVLQLDLWERQGLRVHLDAGLLILSSFYILGLGARSPALWVILVSTALTVLLFDLVYYVAKSDAKRNLCFLFFSFFFAVNQIQEA